VRERRGLAYEIGSQVRRFRDTGLFSVSAGVEHKHLVRCLDLILKELAEIRRKKVTPQEFERAREFFMGQVLFSLEDTVDHMCWIGECEMLLGRVEPAEHILRQAALVTIGDLQEAARKILQPDRLSLAVVGPVKGKAQRGIQRLLGGKFS
jgi:predicted Zn-dependent peptidase